MFLQLEGLAAQVDRIAGPNRYATAVAISAEAFPTGSGSAYLATGLNFPDALAGAAAAGFHGAPVLLVPGTSIPGVVESEIARLAPDIGIILGGTSVVTVEVADLLEALLGV